jgi:GTP-binding protein
MKILRSDLAVSAHTPRQFPETALPEIALAGRSNAGKSSVINALLNRKNLARSGSRPGVTQAINFFIINDAFYFVDLPGYGYAKVSKAERDRWRRVIEDYFSAREPLRVVAIVLDARRDPDDLDRMLIDYLDAAGIPWLVVANKADKMGNAERERARKALTAGLALEDPSQVLLFSARTGMNISRLWALLQSHL